MGTFLGFGLYTPSYMLTPGNGVGGAGAWRCYSHPLGEVQSAQLCPALRPSPRSRDPHRLSVPSVLQATEHPHRAGGCGGVERHRQVPHRPGPLRQPARVPGLEEGQAPASQVPRQRTACQVGRRGPPGLGRSGPSAPASSSSTGVAQSCAVPGVAQHSWGAEAP